MKPADRDRMISFLNNNLNVMFIGRHGVGKTEMAKSVFNEYYGEVGKDWLYLSAPTMDPWVDLVGIPHEVTDADGTKYLDFVRPKPFAEGTVKAIFLDEYNRAHKKIVNATMELIQFKSINGTQFPNLQVVWVAVNPSEDTQEDHEKTYAVEQLDPAQQDRFQIHWEVPYEVSEAYFIEKYGKLIGTGACQWWRELPDSKKDLVSPRRLEYAIQNLLAKLPINKYVLHPSTHPGKLARAVQYGSPMMVLEGLLKKHTPEKKYRHFFKDPNNFRAVHKDVSSNPELAGRVLRYMTPEQVVKLLTEEKKIETLVFDKQPTIFKEVIDALATGSSHTAIKNRALYAQRNLKNLANQAPKEASQLISSSLSVSENVTAQISTCKANDLEFDTEKMDKDPLSVEINVVDDLAYKKMDCSLVLSNIKIAQDILNDSASSSMDRQSHFAALANCLPSDISTNLAKALLTTADMFVRRSRASKITSSPSVTAIIQTALFTLSKSIPYEPAQKSERLFNIIKSSYPNLFVKYFSIISYGVLKGESDFESLANSLYLRHIEELGPDDDNTL